MTTAVSEAQIIYNLGSNKSLCSQCQKLVNQAAAKTIKTMIENGLVEGNASLTIQEGQLQDLQGKSVAVAHSSDLTNLNKQVEKIYKECVKKHQSPDSSHPYLSTTSSESSSKCTIPPLDLSKLEKG